MLSINCHPKIIIQKLLSKNNFPLTVLKNMLNFNPQIVG
ncbi:MAG: hypothetical protein Satyrvirus10_17 [Satyrvirus sp.]|uniref:Uncharacterized protein n=1 Tax=Satyrvirus sp. TaxID=2487771 RepID=A0A3G5ADM1_9VIRU|nr:MAG: hypothetical protein Satyrvirus10_17 [Satyrvirus sp.]